MITRSDLVLRDLDILKELARTAILPQDLRTTNLPGAFVTFSFSSTDDDVAKIFEPGALLPSARLEAMKKVSTGSVLTGASLMPLLPFISDTEESIRQSYQRLSDAGARYIFPASLTLFGNGPADSKTLVLRAIEKHYPHLLQKYQQMFEYLYQPEPIYKQHLDHRLKLVQREFAIPMTLLGY